MKDQTFNAAINDFTALMYQKGYRARFMLAGDQMQFHGSLSECLETFLQSWTAKGRSTVLKLETYAAYRHASDHINCVLQGKYDPEKGFQIEQMDIVQRPSGKSQTYRLINNRQIPGIMAVQGLFPKPKPWDHILKGKFRP